MATKATKATGVHTVREVETRVREMGSPYPVNRPESAIRYVADQTDGLMVERFYVVLLDGRNCAVGIQLVSQGTLTASLVHPREVFGVALREHAASILLVHNHPSGDPAPSDEDTAVTRRLAAAGHLLGVKVLDHVIVAGDRHYSYQASQPYALETKSPV